MLPGRKYTAKLFPCREIPFMYGMDSEVKTPLKKELN